MVGRCSRAITMSSSSAVRSASLRGDIDPRPSVCRAQGVGRFIDEDVALFHARRPSSASQTVAETYVSAEVPGGGGHLEDPTPLSYEAERTCRSLFRSWPRAHSEAAPRLRQDGRLRDGEHRRWCLMPVVGAGVCPGRDPSFDLLTKASGPVVGSVARTSRERKPAACTAPDGSPQRLLPVHHEKLRDLGAYAEAGDHIVRAFAERAA